MPQVSLPDIDPAAPAGQERAAAATRSSFPAAWVVAVLIAVSLVAFVRRPDILARPQFWAEDGPIFFVQARADGWHSLFRPQPAYYVVAQRLVACLTRRLPVLWQPACYCYAALGLMLLTAWFCLRARLDYLMDFRGRIALAFALPLVPQSGEIFLVLVNSQWTLAPLLLILILQGQARRFGEAVIDFLGLLLVGLTGPYVVLYAPWFLARFRRVTGGFSPYNVALTAVAWMLALLQIQVMRTGLLPPCQYSSEVHKWLKAIAFWLPGGLFFGEYVPLYLGRLFWIISPALLVLLAWALWRAERKRLWPALALCGAAAATYFGGFSNTPPDVVDTLSPFGGGGRYFYPTYVFFVWMGVIFYHDVSSRLRMAARVALVMILLASASRFTFDALPDLRWAEYATEADAGNPQKEVPVPPGWTFDITARPAP